MALGLLKRAMGHSLARSQPMWEKIYKFGVRGMNFGMAELTTSGEIPAVHYVHSRLQKQSGPLTLVDGGANRGDYALVLDGLFGSSAAIHAFEPLPSTFELLQSATASKPNIICHPYGLGSEAARVELFFNEPGSTIASLYPQRDDHPWRTDLRQSIEIRTLDEVCAERGIERIDFLKLDIEGHEFKALQGARQMLERDAVSFIQWEFGPRHVDSRTFFRDFYELLHERYQIYRIVLDGLTPIAHYDEYLELFGATSNYLAEHKTRFAA